MKVLVTGADGFVGSWLVPRLVADGHEVVAGLLSTAILEVQARRREALAEVRTVALDLLDEDSVRSAVSEGWDAVVHLAAAASGAEAQRKPAAAWEVNTVGTVRLANELGELRARRGDPLLLFVSSGEVYGGGATTQRRESDPTQPATSYAASKLAAEIAVLGVHRSVGLRVIVARPFPHTGPGQDDRFVIPAFTRRILDARRSGVREIEVGNLDPVRDFSHVSDVVDAYVRLLQSGRTGEVYNVASGIPVSVRDLFSMIAAAVGHEATPKVTQELVRNVDVPHLVGDATKLGNHTAWQPTISLKQALQEVVNAQAN